MFPTFPSASTRKSTWRARSTSMCVPELARTRAAWPPTRALSSRAGEPAGGLGVLDLLERDQGVARDVVPDAVDRTGPVAEIGEPLLGLADLDAGQGRRLRSGTGGVARGWRGWRERTRRQGRQRRYCGAATSENPLTLDGGSPLGPHSSCIRSATLILLTPRGATEAPATTMPAARPARGAGRAPRARGRRGRRRPPLPGRPAWG